MAHCKRFVVVGILFLAVALTPVAAVSGPLEHGVAAYASGDSVASLETKAWKLRKLLAEQDDTDSQYNLGNMYISCNVSGHEVKNVAEPVHAYSLLSEGEVVEKHPR